MTALRGTRNKRVAFKALCAGPLNRGSESRQGSRSKRVAR